MCLSLSIFFNIAAVVLLFFTIIGNTWNRPVLTDIYFAKYDTMGLASHLSAAAPDSESISGSGSSMGLRGYYTFGMWGYCAGDNFNPDRNYCSNHTAAYRFNPIAAIQNDVPSSQTFPVPTSIANDLPQYSRLSLTAFVFVFLSFGLAIFAIVVGAVDLHKGGFRPAAVLASAITCVAFLLCAIAAAIYTGMYISVANRFTDVNIGVTGSVGKAIGLIWGASLALLFGSMTFCLGCFGCTYRGRQKY